MSTKQLEKFSTEVKIPENVKVSFKKNMLNVEGPLGKTYKNFKKIPVDIGFIVFNHETYPNLINFFSENQIKIEKSDMSFSVSVQGTSFEYCGRGLKGMFSNKSNLFIIF